MSRRKRPAPAPDVRETPAPLGIAHPDAAGIDVHPDLHLACVPPGRDPEGSVRQFGANTGDLHALADRLQPGRVTAVAPESTGESGIPLFESLNKRVPRWPAAGRRLFCG